MTEKTFGMSSWFIFWQIIITLSFKSLVTSSLFSAVFNLTLRTVNKDVTLSSSSIWSFSLSASTRLPSSRICSRIFSIWFEFSESSLRISFWSSFKKFTFFCMRSRSSFLSLIKFFSMNDFVSFISLSVKCLEIEIFRYHDKSFKLAKHVICLKWSAYPLGTVLLLLLFSPFMTFPVSLALFWLTTFGVETTCGPGAPDETFWSRFRNWEGFGGTFGLVLGLGGTLGLKQQLLLIHMFMSDCNILGKDTIFTWNKCFLRCYCQWAPYGIHTWPEQELRRQ